MDCDTRFEAPAPQKPKLRSAMYSKYMRHKQLCVHWHIAHWLLRWLQYYLSMGMGRTVSGTLHQNIKKKEDDECSAQKEWKNQIWSTEWGNVSEKKGGWGESRRDEDWNSRNCGDKALLVVKTQLHNSVWLRWWQKSVRSRDMRVRIGIITCDQRERIRSTLCTHGRACDEVSLARRLSRERMGFPSREWGEEESWVGNRGTSKESAQWRKKRMFHSETPSNGEVRFRKASGLDEWDARRSGCAE